MSNELLEFTSRAFQSSCHWFDSRPRLQAIFLVPEGETSFETPSSSGADTPRQLNLPETVTDTDMFSLMGITSRRESIPLTEYFPS
jgi:hypothetical protein